MTWTPDICIYHSPCDDGFASAWVARRRWPDIVTVGTNYGLPLPDVDLTGKRVLIADFSFKPDVLREMAAKAHSIVVLDHHKTAQADLKEFQQCRVHNDRFELCGLEGAFEDCADAGRPKILAHFDMERSGSVLTWQFCFPDKPAPALICYIGDRDLWRFRLKETRAVSLYLRSFPYDFAQWDMLFDRVDDPAAILREAGGIERFYDRQVADLVATASLKQIGEWKDIPTVHAPYAFASDVGNQLLKAYPDAPFACVVVVAHGGITYSLRSEDSQQDVSEVARSNGGGGHRNAAGFRVQI